VNYPQDLVNSQSLLATPTAFAGSLWNSIEENRQDGFSGVQFRPREVQVVHRYQTAINQHYASGRHSHEKVADVLNSLLKRPVGT
jgi:hypothetical protein